MAYEEGIESPFNPEVRSQGDQTLPLDEVIRQAISGALLRVRVCIPCAIVKVNGNQSVDIQPLLQSRYRDGTLVNMPIVHHVMVSMPMGADYSIKLPIAVGDTGYGLFADRSLDNWSASDGGIVDPQDSRQHDLADPIFVPGLVPFSKQTQDQTTDLIIKNGSSALRVQKAGTFLFEGAGAEVLDTLIQITTQLKMLSDTLGTDTVNTIFGPMMLNQFSEYTQVGKELGTLLQKLTGLKGS